MKNDSLTMHDSDEKIKQVTSLDDLQTKPKDYWRQGQHFSSRNQLSEGHRETNLMYDFLKKKKSVQYRR